MLVTQTACVRSIRPTVLAEVDPLILELRADLGKYRAELRSSTSLVESNLKRQEKSVQNLERQMQRSSGAISSSLKGIALSFAGAFSAQQLVGVLDNFTKIQNALKIAGLEGQHLESVQKQLFDTAQKYGTSLVDLAQLYGNVSAASKELNLNQSDQLKLTELTSAAIKAQGAGTAAQLGALQQFSQLLGGTVVQAQEYNSINDGARPILQAVANNIDRFGGSLAKLRAEVVKGKLGVGEFVQAALKGTEEVKNIASKANLTLAASFQALSDAFTVFIGQSETGRGATETLSVAIKALADNIETIIPALAVIATAIGGRMAAAALVGGTALRTLAAYASIATTSLAGTALAARGAGAALLGAFGGPVGLAITALALGLGYLATRTSEAEKAAQALEVANKVGAEAAKAATDAAERLASAHGKTRVEALAAARAERESTKQKLAGARASLLLAEAEVYKARATFRANAATNSRNTTGAGGGIDRLAYQGDRDAAAIEKAESAARAYDATVTGLLGGLSKLDAAISGAGAPAVAAVGDGKKGPKGTKGGGADGPSAAEIESRVASELRSIAQQAIAAELQITKGAEERAELELRALEIAKDDAEAAVANNKEYNDVQKERIREQNKALFFDAEQTIESNKQAQIAQEASDIAQAQNDVRLEELRGLYDLAETQSERRKLALQIIAAEFDLLEAKQQEIIDAEISSGYQKERARLELAKLQAERASQTNDATKQTAGPLEQFRNDLSKTPAELNEEFEAIAVNGLQSLNDGLTDAILNSENLGDVFKNVAKSIIADLIRIAVQQLIVKSLMDAIGSGGGASGGGGGGFGNILASVGTIFGRASGGPVSAGQVYRVNEGNREYFKPNVDGRVIPLSQTRAMPAGGSGGGGMSVIRLELSGDIQATMKSQATDIAIEVVRAAAPSIRDMAVAATFSRAQRPGFA